MIRKLIRQMLAAQILSALTVSLCLMIDNIMIANYLGVEALAAFSIANPVLLAIGAVGTMLGAGVQVVCSRSLGKGLQEETNAGYSSALALTAGISAFFMIVVFLFTPFIARVLGAGSSGSLHGETTGYITGFTIGAPASMGAIVLVPFLQMAGQSGLLIVAVLGMTVADVALDLLNVLVFHGGMFGMGLASSLSYYIALIISCFYFFSSRSVFRFSLKSVSMKKALEILRRGTPALFGMASTVILVFAVNRILKRCGGNDALAAYTVISSLSNAASCINTGIGGVSLTLVGVLFHEEDRTGLRELMRLLARYSIILGAGMGALLLAFAPALVSIFLSQAGPVRDMAVRGLRMFAAGLIPCCLNNALRSGYQATGREKLTEIICLAEGALFPALAAWILSLVSGTGFIWLFFAIGEAAATLALCVMVRSRNGQWSLRDERCLLLKKDFGVPPEDVLEADVETLEEVAEISEKAERYCLERGQDARTSSHIALCIEEMAGNIIRHGFTADGKEHHLSLRLLRKKDMWILRFRDDCGAFDPVHYVPGAAQEGLGIRLVMGMVQDAKYTYSMNMNNLTLKLGMDC